MTTQHKDHLGSVADFMKAMGQPVGRGWEDGGGLLLGMSLIAEEHVELVDACHDLMHSGQDMPRREAFTKELADLLYVAYWLAARIGIDIDAAFRAVHKSNMSKLGADGRPLKREDGKVLKGPDYVPPDLSRIVESVPVSL